MRRFAFLRPVLALFGCGLVGGGPAGPPATTPTVPGVSQVSDGVAKLIVIPIENHSLTQVRDGMPATWALTEQFGFAWSSPRSPTRRCPTTWRSPVAPRAVFATTGPKTHGRHGASVFGREALRAGETAKVYAEGMEENCELSGYHGYAVRHNPWTYHLDERADCERYDVPLTKLSTDVATGELPRVGMIVPDTCHDGHDCHLRVADRWFSDILTQLLSGPDWKAGTLAIVITADEDDRKHDNRVLTMVLHPGLTGRVIDTPLTHYGLSRAMSEMSGSAPLAEARTATSLLTAFGLQPVPLGD